MGSPFTTPDWVKEAIFYQIFPDRFASSARISKPGNLEAWDTPPTVYGFKGGDLLGVSERLDYLVDLGITAIYFNPIFQSAANHRYHTHDYFTVDPLLGGQPAFRELLDRAHQRGLRIVLDGVFNHASRGFFQFNHLLENGASSPYLDWFFVHGFPLNAYSGRPNYTCWAGLAGLPKLNTANPQVRQFIFNVAQYWLEQGIDGWRLDVPFEIDDDGFWQDFRRLVKSVNPQAYIVGEVSREAQRWLQGDQFDAVMNYQLTQACLGFFAGKRIDRSLERGFMGLPSTQVLEAEGFARRIQELLSIYPWEVCQAQLNLLDSHDMPRFTALAGGDSSAYRLAVLFLMTYPGAPCLYYGDEVGLSNGPRPIPEDARYAFSWDSARWDHDLHRYIQGLIALRKAHPALRQGSFEIVYAQGETLISLRRTPDESLLVVINAGERPAAIRLAGAKALEEGSHWQPLIGSNSPAQVINGDFVASDLPPRSGAVYRLA